MVSSNGAANEKVLSSVLDQIKNKVESNRAKFDDSAKSLKDFRRIFDQESSQINQAIFNDAPTDEIHTSTLRTVCTLVEILSRTAGKKDSLK